MYSFVLHHSFYFGLNWFARLFSVVILNLKALLKEWSKVLTKYYRYKWSIFQKSVQHFIGDFWDLTVSLLVQQPSQELFFLHEVSFVDVRDAPLEQHHGGDGVNAVLLGLLVIIYLDERDVVLITFVVNVLQLRQNLLAFLLILIVWKKYWLCKLIFSLGLPHKVALINPSSYRRYLLLTRLVRKRKDRTYWNDDFSCWD